MKTLIKKMKNILLLILLVTVPVVKGITQCWLSQLSQDIKASQDGSEFKGFIKNNAEAFDTYRTLVIAKGLSSELRNDTEILKYVLELKRDSKFIESIGGENGLINFLKTASKEDILARVLANGALRLFTDVDAFKAAIAKGENVFYVGKHSDISPRPTGVQSHHGVNSVWMKNRYSNYSMDNAPSVYMINDPNHNATRGVFNTWRSEIAKSQGVSISNIDYGSLTENDILKLAERQFDAADVPKIVRDEYYTRWKDYSSKLTKK